MESALRILHLEDDPLDSKLVWQRLRKEGLVVEIDRVMTAAAFSEAIEHGSYGLILSDYTIPGVSVEEMLRFAKQARPEVPFVFFSGTMGEDVGIEMLKLGASDYVLKQRIERLVPAVRRALQERIEQQRRQQAEEQRRISEDRYRSLVQASAQAVWVAAPDGEIQEDSPSWRAFTGQSYEQFRGWGWLDALHPSDRERAAALWQRAVEQHTVYELEFRVHNAAGAYRTMAVRGVPVLDGDGHIREWVGMNTDITEQRQAEEKLRQNEALLRKAISAPTVGVLFFNLDGRIHKANETFVGMTGYSSDELRDAAHWRMLTAPEFWEVTERTATNMAERGEAAPYEKRMVRKDGSSWWGLFAPQRLSGSGWNTECVEFIIDITERKQAEADLAETRRRLDSALIAGEIGTFDWDVAGERVWGDANFARMFGLTLDERGAAPLADYVAVMHPDDQERVRRRIALTVDTGVDYEIEYRVISGGRTRWLLVRAKPERDASGRVIRAAGVCLDVTERKWAEESLRSSERKFRAVFEQAVIGMGRVRFGDARWVDVNEAFCRMLGYTREEMQSTPWPEMTHPDDVDLDLVPFRRMAAGELNHYSVEKRFIRKDGHQVWAKLTLSLVRDAQNRPEYEVAIIEDITARKRTEQQLRASEERYRVTAEELQAIMDATPAGICVAHDPQCHVITGNRVAHELFGIPVGQNLSSTPMSEAGSPDYRILRSGQEVQGQDMPVQQAAATGRTIRDVELEVVRRDGIRRVFLITAAPLRSADGTVRGAVGAFTEITERKRTEEALRQSTSLVRAISDSTGDVIFAKDREGRLTYANPATLALVGKSLEQVLGHTDLELLEDKQAAAAVMANDQHIMASGAAADLEETVPLPDGTPRVWLSRKMPYRDAEGRVIGLLGVSRDITARKATEEELAAAHRSAQRAREAAEEASKAKDHFLAVLSHELRTPLAPVVTAVSMLQEGELDEQSARDTLEMVRRNVEMEARLIDDLLDVTRIVRGKIQLDRKPTPLQEIIRRAVEVCQQDIESRQVHFGVSLNGGGDEWVDADAARLQQVFWNLLKNAVKFTPHGGCIGIRCWREDGQVITEVQDSGEGIEPHLLPHIFNAFEQGGARITRQFGGLGLGLTITKGVVELHGGTIEAQSAGRGKGATFRVRLPICPAYQSSAASMPAQAAPDSGAAASAALQRIRILLVEDHGDTAKVMRRLLSARGYEVETAGDVATALDRAEHEPFDLLLSDLGLPDGSGVDLMRTLREHGRTLPGIALSGFGQEEDIRRSKEAGFAAHLTKPTNPDQLTRAIGRVIRPGAGR